MEGSSTRKKKGFVREGATESLAVGVKLKESEEAKVWISSAFVYLNHCICSVLALFCLVLFFIEVLNSERANSFAKLSS